MSKIVLLLFLIALIINSATSNVVIGTNDDFTQTKLWKYQCIDTMKTSRDRARSWGGRKDVSELIEKEVKIISEIGANCIVIDTPYDDEFVPFLKSWVGIARKYDLSVWFRGNWSQWEGWFDYPKEMTPREHLTKTSQFITNHSDLFADGDAFDPCPECEGNGYWRVPDDNEEFREFKRSQKRALDEVFDKIGKKVITNRLSVIGGRAKDVFDAKTYDALDHEVTIDHYVESAALMEEYIRYFADEFNTKTFVGEFGAPIPDINGPMDEEKQAAFIDEVFAVLYTNRTNVIGVNYWVLTDGTTALLNPDGTARKAVEVLKNYFLPARISGVIVNTIDENLSAMKIRTSDGTAQTTSDESGRFQLTVPAGTWEIIAEGRDYEERRILLEAKQKGDYNYTVVTEPQHIDVFYWLRLRIKQRNEILSRIFYPIRAFFG